MSVDAPRVVGVVGLLLHLAVGVFPYSASGLVAPLWGIVALGVLWLGLLAVAVVLLRRRPALVLLVPVLAVLLWVGALTAGEQLLGWTA